MLYKQIAEEVFFDILSGKYKPGEQLPSVRKLADFYQVNVNTVQRSIRELKIMGLVVKRKMFNYVIQESEIIETIKANYIKKIEDDYLKAKERIGIKYE